MRDLIVRVIARFMIPFIQLYGLYIIVYGHLSPGGGFAGGTVMASSLILYLMAYGLHAEERRFPEVLARLIETGGALSYILIGMFGIFLGGKFLGNQSVGIPLGTPGRLLSGGFVLLLTFVIGLKVASTMITLFCHLIEEEKEVIQVGLDKAVE